MGDFSLPTDISPAKFISPNKRPLSPMTPVIIVKTVIDSDHVELSYDRKQFLEERGHVLLSKSGGAPIQQQEQDRHDHNQLQSSIHSPYRSCAKQQNGWLLITYRNIPCQFYISPSKRSFSSMTPVIIVKVNLTLKVIHMSYAVDTVYYKNWTMINGDHVELFGCNFLEETGNVLQSKSGGTVSQPNAKDNQMLKKPNENKSVSQS
ncbi:gamma-glutamyltranspeptidase 1 [Artemisia annua]|uniref:Gamma-glutamyltranspeptidase 1 n=1 Tax=Artemisia annua TaxID=35608 RepID=A0A2U1PN51_ARTAN|nr:gamma-glutamyltranspeptidase 1 [Artemisia annua]